MATSTDTSSLTDFVGRDDCGVRIGRERRAIGRWLDQQNTAPEPSDKPIGRPAGRSGRRRSPAPSVPAYRRHALPRVRPSRRVRPMRLDERRVQRGWHAGETEMRASAARVRRWLADPALFPVSPADRSWVARIGRNRRPRKRFRWGRLRLVDRCASRSPPHRLSIIRPVDSCPRMQSARVDLR